MIAFVVLRIITINAFALSSAPIIVGEELAEIYGSMLISSGLYTQDEVDNMSWNEIEMNLYDGINKGYIDVSAPLENVPIRDKNGDVHYESFPTFTDFFKFCTDPSYMYEKMQEVNATPTESLGAAVNIAASVVSRWFADKVQSDSVEDYVKPTAVSNGKPVDMHGFGAKVERYLADSSDLNIVWYCDYVVYGHSSGTPFYYMYNGKCYTGDGNFLWSYSSIAEQANNSSFYFKVYGDVRTETGTQVETEEEMLPIVGEVADVTVTPDILNPDGTVTIDGVTYYPSDYIDWTNFDDTAIIELLNEILKELDRSAVVEQDKDTAQDMVGDVSVDLDISEFNNLQMPAGIADVFPFCLPFDFVRGIQGLVAKPKIPEFKADLDLTNFCGFNLGKHTIKISLEKWEPAVVIFRWFSLILFSYSLIILTGKIVKGAGA